MKVYRRPRISTSRRTDNDQVAYVNHKELQRTLADNKRLTFRIDRHGHERIALGGIEFEQSDLFALLEGATARLQSDYGRLRETLEKIQKTLNNKALDEQKRLKEIQWIISTNNSLNH